MLKIIAVPLADKGVPAIGHSGQRQKTRPGILARFRVVRRCS